MHKKREEGRFSKLDFSGRGGEGRGWNRKWALADPVMQERGGFPGLGALFETVFFDSKKKCKGKWLPKKGHLFGFCSRAWLANWKLFHSSLFWRKQSQAEVGRLSFIFRDCCAGGGRGGEHGSSGRK